MKTLISAAILTAFLTLPAYAQQQPDPVLMQKAIGVLQQQRNAGLDAAASAEARAAMLADENAKLKKQIEDLAKKEPKTEAPE
jgi:hypothetical protein